MKTIDFKGNTCLFTKKGAYMDGTSAFELQDPEDGFPIATCTVCIPGAALEEGNILIKSWNENAGMKEALMSAKVIGPIIREHPTGFVVATEHALLNVEKS